MNIAVIGYKGMLGYDVVDLLSFSHELTLVDREDCDITRRKDVEKLIKNNHFDCVINCAAYTAVDKAEKEKGMCVLVNSIGVKHLSEVCLENNVFLYHFSTDFVFDGMKKTGYYEHDITSPINYYGITKKLGEDHVRLMGDKGLVIRISWLFGKNGNNFVKKILEKLKQGKPINVVNDQIGCPTYTVDVALLLDKLLKGQYSGTLHFTNKCEGISWYRFARKIAEYGGYDKKLVRPCSSDMYETPAMRPKNSVLSTKKLNSLIDIDVRTWDKALKDYLMMETDL